MGQMGDAKCAAIKVCSGRHFVIKFVLINVHSCKKHIPPVVALLGHSPSWPQSPGHALAIFKFNCILSSALVCLDGHMAHT